MKHLTAALLVILVLLLCLPITAAAQDMVQLKTGTLAANAEDTVFYDIASSYDYFGFNIRSDSVANVICTVDMRAAGAGDYEAKLIDTLTTVTTTGAAMTMTLRSAYVEIVPWGCHELRFRFKKLASGNAGATKHYEAYLAGIKIRR